MPPLDRQYGTHGRRASFAFCFFAVAGWGLALVASWFADWESWAAAMTAARKTRPAAKRLNPFDLTICFIDLPS
jgi:hypothetical protein